MPAFAEPIFDGRLTKKALLGLPDAAFLVSNVLLAADVPVIAEWLPGKEFRDEYWRKLSQRGLAGRLFYAFTSASEYRAWLRFRDGRLTVEG